ncbi:hypothetical protein LCGC14_2509270 [marine sediment metagenome]|uniref:Uncharacterized protein n=1 Tax=marine sediment metagenome TaxID=412755 RepID=A0A0F9AZL7_9ZZZZ
MSSVFFEYEMGETLRDIVTGFRGVVMARAEYQSGCIHYGLQPTKIGADGKLPDWEYLDSSRVERVEEELVGFKRTKKDPPSGPMQNPPKMN